MESVAAAGPSHPTPPPTIQVTELDEYASSSQGLRNQDNAPNNRPILDLLPSKNNGNEDQYNSICVPLYLAALKGDWEKARGLIDGDRSMVRKAITEEYETALHVATKAQQTDFVSEIIKYMDEQDLTLQDLRGDTAFCFAVATGNIQLVETMRNRKSDLATLTDSWNMTPLYLAVLLGKEDMAMFLYQKIQITVGLTREERVRIFFLSIKTDLYDFGLVLLQQYPHLAVTRENDQEDGRETDQEDGRETALHVLARKPPSVFIPEMKSSGNLKLLKRIWEKAILRRVQESTGNRELKSTPALKLLKCIWEEAKQERYQKIDDLIRKPSNLLSIAAKLGNVPFLAELIRFRPSLVYEVDEKKQSIFHVAILHRHTAIFNLIYEIGLAKAELAKRLDTGKNTMLHLTAKYPADQSPVNALPSAALEMQQELLIFKEVEKFMPQSLRELKNEEGLTARELFAKEHKSLMQNAEQWMRNTATASMVVATLIVTVVFQAAFTLPGGYDNKTGMPLLMKNSLFLAFAISDALALSFSSFSILVFLSIITSGYTQTDFLKSLTLKLMIGLLTLFISIIFMMASFSLTFFLIYRDKLSSIPTLTLVFASLPIILFVLLQYPLVKNIFLLTRRYMFLFKVAK